MAYSGYFIKIGDTQLPNSYIKHDSYNISPAQRQDENSYVDEDGKLHRDILSHNRSKIEFETIPMTASQKSSFVGYFSNRDNMTVTYWDDWSETYKTGSFYMADPNIQIYNSSNNRIMYKPIRIALIEY